MKKINLGIALALFAVLYLAEIFGVHSNHAPTCWQRLKGFHLLLGMIGGLFLMISAKLFGKFWLYRKEEHYD